MPIQQIKFQHFKISRNLLRNKLRHIIPELKFLNGCCNGIVINVTLCISSKSSEVISWGGLTSNYLIEIEIEVGKIKDTLLVCCLPNNTYLTYNNLHEISPIENLSAQEIKWNKTDTKFV